jgi:lipoate-protein ligase A
MNLEYKLTDIEILKTSTLPDYHFISWIPDNIYLILGQSNKIESSINQIQAEEDKIIVYKRPSGGETVILTTNTLVLATKIKEEKFQNPDIYFKNANNKIISILEKNGVKNLYQKGISDISINDKKILGSSIYRSKGYVYYHAVLNVCESTDLMEKYILHPSKQPDYRKNRSHKNFVTSLKNEGYSFSLNYLAKEIQG